MPLYSDGLKKIRRCLEMQAKGLHCRHQKVGTLSPEQLTAINEMRGAEGHPPLSAVIVCNGKHLYDSRCIKDGYSIDDVIAQIEIAFNLAKHVAKDSWATVIRSDQQPPDEQGHRITYEVVFECTSAHPNASIFSVIPRGDGKGPSAKRNPLEEGVSVKP